MNSASIKAKGREAENKVVEVLQETWPLAERRRLTGSKDRGDISGIPDTVIEVKDRATMALPLWLRELEEEIANDGALTGFVVHKKRGTTNARLWYCTLPLWRMVELLEAALPHLRRPSEHA